MTRRSPRSRAYAPDPEAPARSCDIPGCSCDAAFRAPKSRDTLRDYWWFCLEHVRAYNANWDYYKGMNPGQIEAELRLDASWQRPSWPMGKMTAPGLEETLGPIFARMERRAAPPPPAPSSLPPELREALAVLQLEGAPTLDEVKARYKQLAKRYHPDATGGDPKATDLFVRIDQAYRKLRGALAPA